MNEQPPAVETGRLTTVVESVKGLTFTNVAIIALLVLALAPAYIAYRLLNDENMLYRLMSTYRELPNPIPASNCTLRMASARGGNDIYNVSMSFASLGTDRWQIGVFIGHPPTPDEIESYCATLNIIMDYMRDPSKPTPTYPGTDEPLIWPYPLAGR